MTSGRSRFSALAIVMPTKRSRPRTRALRSRSSPSACSNASLTGSGGCTIAATRGERTPCAPGVTRTPAARNRDGVGLYRTSGMEGRTMARIERVSYRAGFVKRLRESRRLPATTFEPADLPDDVLALLDRHLLDLAANYGDPEAGDPMQYDERRIERDVEIVVYNRAILRFTTDSEAVRRIRHVCCRLADLAAR